MLEKHYFLPLLPQLETGMFALQFSIIHLFYLFFSADSVSRNTCFFINCQILFVIIGCVNSHIANYPWDWGDCSVK